MRNEFFVAYFGACSFPLSVSSSGQKALDNLLCVVADHSESKGRFLEDPGFPGSAVFLQSWGQKEYTYIASSTEAARSSATSYTNGTPSCPQAAI
jgi:hypothetical protein